VIGAKPVSELANIRVDLCFLGANAMDAKSGLTETDYAIVQVKKAMIESSEKLAVLTISEKLNTVFKMKLCSPSKIDYLITELNPADKKLSSYQKNMILL
jgi:DeoR/GlpR family transcriptional regulator of sugar metabolism